MPNARLERTRNAYSGAINVPRPPCAEYVPWRNPHFLVDGLSACAICQHAPVMHARVPIGSLRSKAWDVAQDGDHP